MTLQSVLDVVSVVTATLILAVGIVLLTGVLLPGQLPAQYRYTLGGVMSAYAVYRIWMAVARIRRRREAGMAE